MEMKRAIVFAMLSTASSLLLLVSAAAQGPVAGPNPATPAIGAPFPPLSAEQQTFLDQVLTYWERRSEGIERYRCEFKRWEYDPVFGPRDTFKAYSEGSIKYAAPDKGLFAVTKMMHYQPPAKQGEQATYLERDAESLEKWICDGQSVFEHDHKNKRLIQRELPPQMRGRAIVEGPLPFLFGANAARIKQRYWIRPLPVPKDVKDEYWLEAFPKTREDAVNYQKVHVIIARDDFLPKGLVIFDRNFDPHRNPARSTFTFEKREVNWNITLSQITFWKMEFYEPEVPSGWKKVIEKYNVPPAAEQYAPASTASRSNQTGPPAATTQR